jgi:hypothetical protein
LDLDLAGTTNTTDTANTAIDGTQGAAVGETPLSPLSCSSVVLHSETDTDTERARRRSASPPALEESTAESASTAVALVQPDQLLAQFDGERTDGGLPVAARPALSSNRSTSDLMALADSLDSGVLCCVVLFIG